LLDHLTLARCYHEAGHCAADESLGDRVPTVGVRAVEGRRGRTWDLAAPDKQAASSRPSRWHRPTWKPGLLTGSRSSADVRSKSRGRAVGYRNGLAAQDRVRRSFAPGRSDSCSAARPASVSE
jgi:hypothetical protein